jgi:TrmH RNA methyltransferase
MKNDELRICGLAAVQARFRRDASSIARLYFDAPTSKRIGILCKALAGLRKIYRCVEPAELEKIAGTVHHGGIVAVVPNPPAPIATAAEAAQWARRREPLVVFDRIGNAHNLGAIARTMAFFGVPRLVIGGDIAAARPGDAAYRVAEGGLEFVEVRIAGDIPVFLRMLAAAGFDVIGAATRGGRALAAKAGGTGTPWALVLGNEERGLATIPGGGRIESLNVSAAAAVFLHDLVSAKQRTGEAPAKTLPVPGNFPRSLGAGGTRHGLASPTPRPYRR